MADLIQITKELQRLSIALAKAINDYQSTIVEAAELRSQYEISYAQALLKFRFEKDATEAIKKSLATKVCAAEMTQSRVKDAMRDALRERVRSIQVVISVQQSLLRHLEETLPSGY